MKKLAFLTAFSMMALFVFAPAAFAQDQYEEQAEIVEELVEDPQEPVEGKIRRAQLPAKEEPVFFGVHGGVAEHYGVSSEDEKPYPSTLDYLVAATGG